MFGRASLIAAIVLTSGLAGCIGGGKDEPVEPQDANSTGLPDNATVAPDGRGDISAFKETNKTETTGIGAMMHEHDYWGGKERLDDVAWIDAGLIPFPVTPCKKSDGSCTAGGSGETYPAGTAIADFDLAPPPEMGMVYEGTKTVELKLVKLTGGDDAAPANPVGEVYFDYLAANDEPGQFRKGGQLKLNEPFKIDIAATDADMPHQTKSLWVFRIYSNSQMVAFNFNITMSLVKGYDVVNWPPHPDLYADKPERIVYEGPVKASSKGTLDSNLYGTDSGWLHPEKVISWGTDKIDVTVTNIQFHGDAPVNPDGFVLEYHNASKPPLLGHGTQFGGRLTDPAATGTEYHFTIDLGADRGDAYDTPYAQYSRWGFRFVPQFGKDDAQTCPSSIPLPTGGDIGPFVQQFLVGCQWYPWTITYDMKIVAHGHSTAAGAPEAVG